MPFSRLDGWFCRAWRHNTCSIATPPPPPLPPVQQIWLPVNCKHLSDYGVLGTKAYQLACDTPIGSVTSESPVVRSPWYSSIITRLNSNGSYVFIFIFHLICRGNRIIWSVCLSYSEWSLGRFLWCTDTNIDTGINLNSLVLGRFADLALISIYLCLPIITILTTETWCPEKENWRKMCN